MLAQAIHNSAGVGVGIFLGCLIGLSMLKRQGRASGVILRDSVPFTALVAGMTAWLAFAVMRLVLGL